MEQWKDISQPLDSNSIPTRRDVNRLPSSHPESRLMPEIEKNNSMVARKVQKADRERLRRDKLNEQFLELGNTLDPDRPKNDKATILTDTVQLLKDLTSEVNRLKAECAALSEESRELVQEKNELREEKASLRSDVDNLNVQYQQRLQVMVPWVIDPSVVMAPTYSYPVPLPIPQGPIPIHPSMQPFAIPNPCSTYIPYPCAAAAANPQFDPPSINYPSTSRVSSKQGSESKSLDRLRDDGNDEKCDESADVVTELELKTPGSTVKHGSSVGNKKGKQLMKNGRSVGDESCSSRQSSSQCLQDSTSNNTSDVSKSNK